MKVLILGGTGQISTAITRQLLARGDEVTHFNRGKTAAPAEFAGRVRHLSGDRKDFATFERTVRQNGPVDAVIDMITFTPAEMQSLVRSTAGLARRVLFCSTVDVYSKPYRCYPVREDHPRGDTPTQYGRDKAACEDLFLAAHARGDFEGVILRPAYTYGEGHALLHSFGWDTRLFARLLAGKPVICHGDGTSLWPSCHADDVAVGFVSALTCPALTCPDAPGKAYTLASDEWITFDDHYRTIARAIGAPEPKLVHIPSDVLARWAPQRAGLCDVNFKYSNLFDISLARQDLGFSPRIRLEDGARRCYEWLKARGKLDTSDDPEYDALLARWAQAAG